MLLFLKNGYQTGQIDKSIEMDIGVNPDIERYFNNEFVITNRSWEHIPLKDVIGRMKSKGSRFGEVRTIKTLKMMGLKVAKVYTSRFQGYIAVFGIENK
jgi:hypothetical protein